jgi:hypothetical protein
VKKVPVKGFVLHSKDSGNKHTHELLITSWEGRPVYHVHHFSGVTTYDDGYVHEYMSVTEPAPTGVKTLYV